MMKAVLGFLLAFSITSSAPATENTTITCKDAYTFWVVFAQQLQIADTALPLEKLKAAEREAHKLLVQVCSFKRT